MRLSSTSSSSTLLFFLVIIAATTFVVANKWVNVYDGPTECEGDDKVVRGKYLSMHYTGTIDESSTRGEKGHQFDSSRKSGETFMFQIGKGEVIKGWDLLLLGLCKGAKVTLVIPPKWGYGEEGSGVIPPHATLKFDVEIVDVREKPATTKEHMELFGMLDEDEDGRLSEEEVDAFWDFQGKPTPKGMFAKLDANKNGYIDEDEFAAAEDDEEDPDEVKSEL